MLICYLPGMHEFEITQSILDITLNKAKEAQASRVTEINLVVGEWSSFAPECIEFYFDFLGKGTIAEEANLHFKSEPAQLRCRSCSAVFHPQNTQWVCPKCQSQILEIVGGRELYIATMEVE